jgi:hypothetical protein
MWTPGRLINRPRHCQRLRTSAAAQLPHPFHTPAAAPTIESSFSRHLRREFSGEPHEIIASSGGLLSPNTTVLTLTWSFTGVRHLYESHDDRDARLPSRSRFRAFKVWPIDADADRQPKSPLPVHLTARASGR